MSVVTERKRAEALLAGEKRLLEQVARGSPLPAVLEEICRLFDELSPGLVSTIMLVEGERMRLGAAPNLPPGYTGRMADLPLSGPQSGLCALAVARRAQVIASDLASDPAAESFRDQYLAHGLRALWTTPFMSEDGLPLGTFAIFSRQPGTPTAQQIELIEPFTHIASIAVERKRNEDALLLSEERYALAMQASGGGHWDWKIGSDEYYTSPRYFEMLGLPPGTTSKGRAEALALVPFLPEDRSKYDAAVAEHFAGKTTRVDIQLRMLVRGELRWGHAIGMCLRDAAGSPVRWAGSFTDITEHKRAEEALRLSEERYALAMQASGEGHWDWKIASDEFYASPRWREISGFAPDEEIGGRARMMARYPFHPEDRPRYEAAVAEHFAGTTPIMHMDLRILPHGKLRWVRFIGLCLRDAAGMPVRWAGSISDITEKRNAEEALRESEARFRSLSELSSDWYWMQDEQFRFTHFSAAAASQAGYAAGPSMGKTRWELPLTPLSSTWEEHKAVLAAHLPFRDFEYSRLDDSGKVAYISTSGVPMFDAEGRFKGYQGMGRSVTDRREAELHRQELERRLRQSQRLESMGTLAGGIAHDFNNILGAILGYGEMALRDAPEGSRLRRDLESITAAGERGRALVDRVLAFSRSGVGERVPVHVEKIAREALDLLSAKLPPNVTLHAKLHAGRAAMLGDATQVHQVLMNLVTNAIQAMPAGGTLRVSLRAERIAAAHAPAIGAIASGDHLVLEVSDTGTGIPPDILDRIFDPFFTTKEVGTGTGLGLSLVHGIVTEVGGAIDVASAPGKGSTFTVYLPRLGDAAEADVDEAPALPRGDGQRVLIVDDEEPLVELAARTLEELGYAPVGFTSSAAALSAFRADPQAFDALITDERMPGLSGLALIREVRGIRGSIPIVLMSGYVGGAVARQARESGAAEVLTKPLSARDLATSLARVLQP